MNAIVATAGWPGLREVVRGIIHAAVTHVTALRSVIADAVDNYLKNTGTGNTDATLRLRDSITTIVDFEFTLGFGSASSGVLTLADAPIEDVPAVGAGDVDNAQILDRDSGLAISCSVTATGMGGDIEMDNVSVAVDQLVTLTSLTYEAPA